jgi:DNA-binding MarR family transcriptional regulator
MNYKEANFTCIKNKTNATDGNLSVQINKLKDAGYIAVERKFKDNYSETVCKITDKGIAAFDEYVKSLKTYLKVKK